MPHDENLTDLKARAVSAARHSYSPYSRFPVGAAVRVASGRVYAACNVENASLGLTQCAERVAMAAAVADGAAPGSLQCLVLYTPGKEAHAPCGACRQVMSELMAPGSPVISCCDGAMVRTWVCPEFLPDAFSGDVLRKTGE